jgi:hypothetical protein
MLQPVGPLPPSVYWRRRGVAAAAAVLAFALLVWALAAALSADGGADASAAAPSPAPTAGPPSPVASLGALPAPSVPGLASGPPGPALMPSGAASLLGPGGLPGTRPQTGTGPLPGTAARPGADSVSGAGQPGGARPGIVPPGPPPGATPGPAPGATATSSPPASAPAPAPPSAAPAPPRCADGDLRVAARTDKPRYPVGDHPLFSLVITNTGSAPCVRDLDAARQAMAVVRKPGDGLWGSNDCSPAHTSDVRTLAPGQDTVFTVRWGGRTSEPGCSGDRAVVPPGDYQLLTRLDGTVSAPARFTLTP